MKQKQSTAAQKMVIKIKPALFAGNEQQAVPACSGAIRTRWMVK